MAEVLLVIVAIMSIISASVFILFVNKTEAAINVFGIYLVLCAIFELIARFTAQAGNVYYYHLFNILEFLLLSIFFMLHLKMLKKFFPIIILGLGMILLNRFYFQTLTTYNFYASCATYIYFIGFSITILYYLLNADDFTEKDKTIKYFIYGLLFNFCGSFTIHLFADVIVNFSRPMQQNIWMVNVILNIIAQAFYLIALSIIIPKKKLINV